MATKKTTPVAPSSQTSPNEEHEGERFRIWRVGRRIFLIDKKRDPQKYYIREYKSDHAALCAFGKARNNEGFLTKVYGRMLVDEARSNI